MKTLHPVIENDIQAILKKTTKELKTLEDKKIAITGSLGMLGKYLVYTFLYANKYILNRPLKLYLITRNKNYFFGRDKNIQYVKCDIAKTSPRIKDIDYILHAASKSAPKIYTEHMVDTLNTNIQGTYSLLNLCTEKTKSVLYFSTAEIYGFPEADTPINESYIGVFDHLNIRSCYTEGKRAAETIWMNYFYERKVPVKIARIFHTFGPGLNLDDGRAFSDFIKFGLQHKDIEIKGNKNIKRSYLYIKDATIMFIKILLSGENGEIYNVGNDKNVVSVRELAQLICDIFNETYKKKIMVVIKKEENFYYKHAVKSIVPDIDKFNNTFHYSPDTNIEAALRKTIQFLSTPKDKTITK